MKSNRKLGLVFVCAKLYTTISAECWSRLSSYVLVSTSKKLPSLNRRINYISNLILTCDLYSNYVQHNQLIKHIAHALTLPHVLICKNWFPQKNKVVFWGKVFCIRTSSFSFLGYFDQIASFSNKITPQLTIWLSHFSYSFDGRCT